MTRRLWGFLLCLLVAPIAPLAHGQTAPVPPVHRQTPPPPAELAAKDNLFSVSMVAGVGSPLGFGGLELGVDLSPRLQMAMGAGWGEGGFNAALTTRLRFWGAGGFFTFAGAGVSYGYEATESIMNDEHPDEERFAVKHAFYANGELGFGWRMASGAQLMGVLGFATLINMSEATCVENCTVTSAGGTTLPTAETTTLWRVTPYLAVHIGMTF